MNTYTQQIAEAVREAAADEMHRRRFEQANTKEAKIVYENAYRAIRSLDLDAIIASVPVPELPADERERFDAWWQAEGKYRSQPKEKCFLSWQAAKRDALTQALPMFNSIGIAEHWSVTVEACGERVLCISDQHYAGASELEQYKETIANCAGHLLAFVGEQARELTDAARLDFITKAPSAWHVQWMQKPGKPVRYRMIEDGEPWGKWHASPRAAIDDALLSASKGEK